jgi:hypothetical protein
MLFKPEHVQQILDLVTIGTDLTDVECDAVHALVREFADCFTLSVWEVQAVKGGSHHLDIKPGTKFSTKVVNHWVRDGWSDWWLCRVVMFGVAVGSYLVVVE